MLHGESLESADGKRLRVAADVMTLFERCAWPGNFRQLGNLLRTAAAMVDEDGEIRREHLPDDFFDDLRKAVPGCVPAGESLALQGASLQDVAASAVAAAIAQHGGNVSAAARALGISRNTVYRKMPLTPGASEPADDL
jgi:transcriptional regulator of acetoin/glycerol metabolism